MQESECRRERERERGEREKKRERERRREEKVTAIDEVRGQTRGQEEDIGFL